MGQAKRRGTFEERRAQAIERDSHREVALPPLVISERRAALMSRPNSAGALAALLSATLGDKTALGIMGKL